MCMEYMKKKEKTTEINISNTYVRNSGICNLCLEEKLAILREKQMHGSNTLTKRSEMISKCRHGNRPSSQAKKKR